MNRRDENTDWANQPAEWESDPELREALRNFKASVDGWSEAMISRPRKAHAAVVRRIWRLAAGWALGCVVVAGAVSGGVYEHHRKLEIDRIAAQQAAEHERQVAAAHAQEEEDLMADVDSDVEREVPSALEPMATLMVDDNTK